MCGNVVAADFVDRFGVASACAANDHTAAATIGMVRADATKTPSFDP
jgi:hypothetical protein